MSTHFIVKCMVYLETVTTIEDESLSTSTNYKKSKMLEILYLKQGLSSSKFVRFIIRGLSLVHAESLPA